ncbi:MAG TPA: hypothetical protein VFF67_02795 [Thermoplasmata archaeon]|nr:hypothetical protein [Thermoplasmata archaeon]
MPFIAEGSSWDRARLAPIAASFREELAELATSYERPDYAVHEPLGMLSARDLAASATALLAATQPPEVPLPVQIAAVNAAYEALVASIDLMKCHTAAPKVPRGPPATSTPPS